MAIMLSQTRNINTTATLKANVSVGTSTSVKLLDANDDRLGVIITVVAEETDPEDALGFYVKFQTASTDNDKKGIFVRANERFVLTDLNMYTGEISAISRTDTTTVAVTEF